MRGTMRRFETRFLLLLSSLFLLVSALAGCGPGATLPPVLVPTQKVQSEPTVAPADSSASTVVPTAHPTSIPTTTETVKPSPTPVPLPLVIALSPDLPKDMSAALRIVLEQIDTLSIADQKRPIAVVERADGGDTRIDLGSAGAPGDMLAERFYAAVAPFDTVTDSVSLAEIQARWTAKGSAPLYVSEDSPFLRAVLGPSAAAVITPTVLLATLQQDPKAIGILPFDQLDPRFKVLAVDGENVLSNRLEAAGYPLAGALKITGKGAEALQPLLVGVIGPETNRAADRLTTLMMTGVTAMSRDTALRMEEKGVLYPALLISDTLAAADITHVSNEIPFLDDCKVNATPNNLVLCSHTSYWKALEAIGADIVGLSGNHVNDFGYSGARRSLQFYRDNKIPIYGGGLNVEEACAPLMWEHNGNTFAFIAALAWWPESAWATDKLPGACYYYDNKDRIKSMVEDLAKKVDIVAVELQYYESYDPFPTAEQVSEFREVRGWGADIVTGVQSHVPQAMEPYGAVDAGGPGIIVYGLGNLFFDQMWSWETRTELYARHTIYEGRVLSTEILTGVLEDYAQPRWATPKERAEILNRIFTAAPKRP
jgi:Bacterial capsule synthesis protein PGA_cap